MPLAASAAAGAGLSTTAAGSTSAGTRGASRSSSASWRPGCSRPRPRFHSARPWVPAWDSLDEQDRQSRRGSWSASPGSCRIPTSRSAGYWTSYGNAATATTRSSCVVSDNGASAEGGATGSINDVRMLNLDPASNDEMHDRIDEIGGPLTHNNYPWGWTMAGNTPFRRWKREVHEGGVADPCIISWPAGRSASGTGGIRLQFTHAIDVLPTLAELAGMELPAEIEGIEQTEIDGASFAYLLAPGTGCSPGTARDPVRRDVRLAGDLPPGLESRDIPPGRAAVRRSGPERAVRRGRLGALPRQGGPVGDARSRRASIRICWPSSSSCGGPRPGATRSCRWTTGCCGPLFIPSRITAGRRGLFRYFPGGAQVPESVAVNVRNRSHALIVDVTVPDPTTDGVLLALGSALGGWSLHILDGQDPLRAQPLRQGTAHRSSRRSARCPASTTSSSSSPKTTGWAASASCAATAGKSPRRHDPPVHAIRLQRRRRRAYLRL